MSERTQPWWRRTLTGYFDPLRRWFERNRKRHQGIRRDLNQARFGVTYDDYLTGVAVTAVAGGLLVAALVIAAVESAEFALGNRLLGPVGTVGGGLVVGIATGTIAWYVGYTRPSRVASRRARRLDVMLPSTTSYMYALAHGGLDAVEIIRRTARREETYGEQAREMQMIVNEMEYTGTDFVTAIQNASELTPCPATADFLADMVGVLESGGDFEAFLDDYRETNIEELTGEQESYLEQIELFAEVYVTVLVAGPLFVIVLLLVVGVLGGETVGVVYVLVYLGLPLGTAGAVFALGLLNSPFVSTDFKTTESTDNPVPDDEDARAYAKRKRRYELRQRLQNPFERFVRQPAAALVLSVPLAVIVAGVAAVAGLAEPTISGFRSRPWTTTTLFGVLPFVIVATPVAVFYELRRRYIDRIRDRLPDVLSSMARANRSGISTAEAIKMEQSRSSGVFAEELKMLHNDIRWFNDPSRAFRRFASRSRLQMTSRTMRLIAEANEASGNLQRTLSVAAEEARFQRQFVAARSREVATHVAVAVISFLVFVGIIVLLQQFYLVRVIEAGAATAGTGSEIGPQMPGSLENIDAEGFRLAFLHSVVIQGACIGFVAGKLSHGTVLAGVKYSIGMVLVAVATFGVIA
ncbi:MAG: flagellar protein FlaJ [Natronomonas sp.]|jgi:flagellar protein FlaJ